ncbi:hypothetical protein OUQ99_29540 [Streptomonospora nanhaiensis]|uniref:Uncharacterized protein n=1 Tax=Streptomonospora nanhaiensis TaxID=1323731 RepID=A0ABY6YLT8_9ACTN|nr:hypothetical protein [Streptomonospora nanhaiensis]WAE73243.1 hypothetical protein OUQ99_29540 [Streptomonospora nanhaiensis]
MSKTGLTVKALMEALDGAVHGLVAAPRGLGALVRTVVVAGEGVPVPAASPVVVPAGGSAPAARAGLQGASAVAALGDDAAGLRTSACPSSPWSPPSAPRSSPSWPGPSWRPRRPSPATATCSRSRGRSRH